MIAYFKDPLGILQSEQEEIEDDIGKKEKSIREFDKQIKAFEKDKELAEGELDELFAQEKVVKRKITKARLEAE